MDFSKLGQNEKLAVYGSVAVIVGGLVGFGYGISLLAVIAAIAMLAIVFLPQMSSTTTLPGSKGSLMLAAGAVAGVVLVLAFLVYAGILFIGFGLGDIFFLIAVAGGLLMAWAGWQEFQSEGGKFQIGAPSGGTASAPPPSSGSDERESAPPPAATAPSSQPPAAAPSPDQASAAQAPPAAAATDASPAHPESAPPADLSPQGDTTPRNDLSPREGTERRDPEDRPLG